MSLTYNLLSSIYLLDTSGLSSSFSALGVHHASAMARSSPLVMPHNATVGFLQVLT